MTFETAVSADNPQIAELYLIIYPDSTKKYYTSWQNDIDFDNGDGEQTYISAEISRTGLNKEINTTPGTMQVYLAGNDFYISKQDIKDRVLDNAEIYIYQVNVANTTEYRTAFYGHIGQVKVNDVSIELECKDIHHTMKKMFPPLMFSQFCNLQFTGDKCGLDKATLKKTGTADAGSDADTLVDSARTEADDYFSGGYVKMTSGNANGEKRPIRSYTTGTIEMLVPFSSAISAGNTYDVYPHCQKTLAGCKRFSNEDNFLGFHYIPRPEEVQI